MTFIQNPILKGFNPDPSIIRVGADYFIATSTFEWFPGVQIHHSVDLVNWELIAHPLNRLSQLDMKGNPDSCGVWAPCLTYDAGVFYLVYSNVRSFDGVWKDTPNYLVTSRDLRGSWSEPIFLCSRGFDGSLFHDDDRRKWFTSMLTDHRKGKFFGGVILQEYNVNNQALTGKCHEIFAGTELGCTEAPHLYKRNGFYYLMVAEGGTEYGHAVSLARSKEIIGPYELHPNNPIISTRHDPSAPLQKCGHADLVETRDGKWYSVFLVGRPLLTLGRCTLGRETAIEEMEWRSDEWIYLKPAIPRLEVPINQTVSPHAKPIKGREDFSDRRLSVHFQSLRIPKNESWLSYTERPGLMRLKGRESLTSLFEQSLVARRIQHFKIEASTSLEFSPSCFQQMAGLVCYYNTGHWYYLHLMGGSEDEKWLQIISCDNYDMQDVLEVPINISGHQVIYFKAKIDLADLQFYYATEIDKWLPVGPILDASILSDDYVREGSARYRPAFTGSFVGICCQDLTGGKSHADFRWFEYRELDD